jgi:hypothetical protein
MSGDGPFFDPITLVDFSIGDPWNVGSIYNQIGFDVMVHLTYDAPIVAETGWIQREEATRLFPHYDIASPVTGNTPLSSNHPTVAPVPEPSTMLLLGSGLVGLPGYGRSGSRSNSASTEYFRRAGSDDPALSVSAVSSDFQASSIPSATHHGGEASFNPGRPAGSPSFWPLRP